MELKSGKQQRYTYILPLSLTIIMKTQPRPIATGDAHTSIRHRCTHTHTNTRKRMLTPTADDNVGASRIIVLSFLFLNKKDVRLRNGMKWMDIWTASTSTPRDAQPNGEFPFFFLHICLKWTFEWTKVIVKYQIEVGCRYYLRRNRLTMDMECHYVETTKRGQRFSVLLFCLLSICHYKTKRKIAAANQTKQ